MTLRAPAVALALSFVAPALALSLAAPALALARAAPARVAHPYVVLRDDGTIAGLKLDDTTTQWTEDAFVQKVVALYESSGAPRPDVISLWTTFDVLGGPYATYFFATANEAKGIGYATIFEGDGTFMKAAPPLRSILVHNNVMKMPDRAARYGMLQEGLAQYLFMLEVSHNWGATLKLDGPDPNVLLGDPPHWSFWLDAGGSPEGGNVWKDNGDGTFTVAPQKRVQLAYSKLDLYVMGLAPASEVPPFGVLVNAVPPEDFKDPMHHEKLNSRAFPWVSDKPLTLKAERRVVKIEDVIAKNGPRVPAYEQAQKAWTLGIALVVGAKDSPADVEAAKAVLDGFASTLAPTFNVATGGRGTMRVVTSSPDGPSAEPGPAAVETPPGAHGCAHACSVGGEERGESWGSALFAAALALAGVSRRHRR